MTGCYANVHHLSHRLKSTATKCSVHVLLSAPENLAHMCRAINDRGQAYTKKHATPFAVCSTAVFHYISLPCGKCCIGLTGGCVERLREHIVEDQAVAESGHLADLSKRCHCTPTFNSRCVLGRYKDEKCRLILEAFRI